MQGLWVRVPLWARIFIFVILASRSLQLEFAYANKIHHDIHAPCQYYVLDQGSIEKLWLQSQVVNHCSCQLFSCQNIIISTALPPKPILYTYHILYGMTLWIVTRRKHCQPRRSRDWQCFPRGDNLLCNPVKNVIFILLYRFLQQI